MSSANSNRTQTEATLADLAIGIISEKLPELLNFLLGFELVNSNDDRTKAAGILGFKIGEEVAYVPILFLGGKIKGNEVLYLKNSDVFTSASKPWVDYLTSSSPGAMGKGQDKPILPQPSSSDLAVFSRSPRQGKVATTDLPLMEGGGKQLWDRIMASDPSQLLQLNKRAGFNAPAVLRSFGPRGQLQFMEMIATEFPEVVQKIAAVYDLEEWTTLNDLDQKTAELKIGSSMGVRALGLDCVLDVTPTSSIIADDRNLEAPAKVAFLTAGGWLRKCAYRGEVEPVMNLTPGADLFPVDVMAKVAAALTSLDQGTPYNPLTEMNNDEVLATRKPVPPNNPEAWMGLGDRNRSATPSPEGVHGTMADMSGLAPGGLQMGDSAPGMMGVGGKEDILTKKPLTIGGDFVQQGAGPGSLAHIPSEERSVEAPADHWAHAPLAPSSGDEMKPAPVAAPAVPDSGGQAVINEMWQGIPASNSLGAIKEPAAAAAPGGTPAPQQSWWVNNKYNVGAVGLGAGAVGAFAAYQAWQDRKRRQAQMEPKMALLTFIDGEDVLNGKAAGLDDNQKTAAIRDGFLIIDNRPAYGTTKRADAPPTQGGGTSPDLNGLFRKYHGTNFEPTSAMDRHKMQALMRTPAAKQYVNGGGAHASAPAAPAATPAAAPAFDPLHSMSPANVGAPTIVAPAAGSGQDQYPNKPHGVYDGAWRGDSMPGGQGPVNAVAHPPQLPKTLNPAMVQGDQEFLKSQVPPALATPAPLLVKGASKEVYTTDHETCEVEPIEQYTVRFDTPRESGFYEILNSAGQMRRVFLAVSPFMVETPKQGNPAQIVVDPSSGRFKKVRTMETALCTGRLTIDESKWKESYGSMAKVKSMQPTKVYMLLDGNCRASAPFTVINKSSGDSGTTDFTVRSLWEYAFSCCPMGGSDGTTLKVVDSEKFTDISTVGSFVFVPSDWRVIELDDEYHDSEATRKIDKEITPGTGATADAAILNGDMFKLRLDKEPNSEKVKITAGNDFQSDGLDSKEAAMLLTAGLRMPAAAALETIKEAFTKGASERCIKGYLRLGLSIPKTADDLSVPRDQIGTGRPIEEDDGITGTNPMGFLEQERVEQQVPLDLNNLATPDQDWRDNDQANWDRIKPQDTQLLDRALASGHQPVFDSALIGTILRTSRSQAQVAQWMPDLVSALDTLCRLSLLYYWHNDDFGEAYGKDELSEFEDLLLDSIKNMGQLCLFLKQHSSDGNSVKVDALAEE